MNVVDLTGSLFLVNGRYYRIKRIEQKKFPLFEMLFPGSTHQFWFPVLQETDADGNPVPAEGPFERELKDEDIKHDEPNTTRDQDKIPEHDQGSQGLSDPGGA